MKKGWLLVPLLGALLLTVDRAQTNEVGWGPDCKALAQSSLEECHAQRTIPNAYKKGSDLNMKACMTLARDTFTACTQLANSE